MFARQLQQTLSSLDLKKVKEEKEHYFLSKFVGAEVRVNFDISEYVFLYKDKRCIAEIDFETESIRLDYPTIWREFELHFNLHYNESSVLIVKYLKFLGMNGFYPSGAPMGILNSLASVSVYQNNTLNI